LALSSDALARPPSCSPPSPAQGRRQAERAAPPGGPSGNRPHWWTGYPMKRLGNSSCYIGSSGETRTATWLGADRAGPRLDARSTCGVDRRGQPLATGRHPRVSQPAPARLPGAVWTDMASNVSRPDPSGPSRLTPSIRLVVLGWRQDGNGTMTCVPWIEVSILVAGRARSGGCPASHLGAGRSRCSRPLERSSRACWRAWRVVNSRPRRPVG
jgi:hypothetical protein